jgi:hypothetical protein
LQTKYETSQSPQQKVVTYQSSQTKLVNSQDQIAKQHGKQYDNVNLAIRAITTNKTQYRSEWITESEQKNDKENMSIFHPHCIRVFNNHRLVSPKALTSSKNKKPALT